MLGVLPPLESTSVRGTRASAATAISSARCRSGESDAQILAQPLLIHPMLSSVAPTDRCTEGLGSELCVAVEERGGTVFLRAPVHAGQQRLKDLGQVPRGRGGREAFCPHHVACCFEEEEAILVL